MLNIKRFVCNMFQENCYVVNDDTNECVIIDCGALYPEERNAMDDYIRQNALVPKHLICTHAHIDHNFGNAFIYDKYGLKPQVCAKDMVLMDKLKEQESGEDRVLERILLRELLEQLGKEERQLIYLRYFADKTQTEVGEQLGISQVQVSRMEKKILEELRRQL